MNPTKKFMLSYIWPYRKIGTFFVRKLAQNPEQSASQSLWPLLPFYFINAFEMNDWNHFAVGDLMGMGAVFNSHYHLKIRENRIISSQEKVFPV